MIPSRGINYGLTGAMLSVVVLMFGLGACGSASTASARSAATPAANSGAAAKTADTGVSGAACSTSHGVPGGMRILTLSQLPPEALTTLRLIAAGGPYPYAQDDTVFGNYGGVLPHEAYGYYHEFTVPAPGAGSRGARRVVTGSHGEDFYTPDHYSTFDWISCGG